MEIKKYCFYYLQTLLHCVQVHHRHLLSGLSPDLPFCRLHSFLCPAWCWQIRQVGGYHRRHHLHLHLVHHLYQVMIVKETISSNGIASPALTIVGRKLPKNGWKINSGTKLVNICKTYQDNQTERCIEENSFDQSDVVKEILLGNKPDSQTVLKGKHLEMNRSISVLQNLAPSLTVTAYGMTFTWSSLEKMSPSMRLTLCFFCFCFFFGHFFLFFSKKPKMYLPLKFYSKT